MRKTFQKGFTLVELALSMAFVGILSVAVVLVIAETVASYRRGLTLAQVNTAGMDIVDDMRLAVSNSSSRAVSADCERYYSGNSAKQACEEDGAYSFVTTTKNEEVFIYDESIGEVPIYGAFCTGTYSYIWNSGYFEMPEAKFVAKENQRWAKLVYSTNYDGKLVKVNVVGGLRKNSDLVYLDGSEEVQLGDAAKPFRLLKIHDTNRAVCISVARPEDELSGSVYLKQEQINLNNEFNITGFGTLDEEPEDLILVGSDNDLALFDLYIARPAESTTQKNMFYAVSFILGTANGGANIKASGQSCKTPTDYKSENFDYCAINKFNFAMQASGEL